VKACRQQAAKPGGCSEFSCASRPDPAWRLTGRQAGRRAGGHPQYLLRTCGVRLLHMRIILASGCVMMPAADAACFCRVFPRPAAGLALVVSWAFPPPRKRRRLLMRCAALCRSRRLRPTPSSAVRGKAWIPSGAGDILPVRRLPPISVRPPPERGRGNMKPGSGSRGLKCFHAGARSAPGTAGGRQDGWSISKPSPSSCTLSSGICCERNTTGQAAGKACIYEFNVTGNEERPCRGAGIAPLLARPPGRRKTTYIVCRVGVPEPCDRAGPGYLPDRRSSALSARLCLGDRPGSRLMYVPCTKQDVVFCIRVLDGGSRALLSLGCRQADVRAVAARKLFKPPQAQTVGETVDVDDEASRPVGTTR